MSEFNKLLLYNKIFVSLFVSFFLKVLLIVEKFNGFNTSKKFLIKLLSKF